jgi:hypothetical protein
MMATRDDYVETLNTCIDRIHAGEQLDDIIGDYPQMAGQLRPMLEAGLLVPRARYPAGEIEQARQRIEPKIQRAVDTIFGGGIAGLPLNLLLGIIIGGGILIIGLSALGGRGEPAPAATTTAVPVTAVPSQHPADSPSTSTATSRPTNTPDQTPVSLEPDSSLPVGTDQTDHADVIVIEGPVDALADSTITIYGTVIVLAADDPRLPLIQPGDIVRVEGHDEGTGIVALSFAFTSVEVYVDGDQTWRDGGTCENPPPAWAPAWGWRLRCEGGAPSTSPPSNDNLPEGCKLTGFGNGNIRIKCSRRSD